MWLTALYGLVFLLLSAICVGPSLEEPVYSSVHPCSVHCSGYMAAPEPPFKRPRAVSTTNEAEAARMCKFIREGIEYQLLKQEKPLDDEIKDSSQWSCDCTPEEVITNRNKLADWIDSQAAHFRNSGEADRWLEEADPVFRQVSKGVNGPLMEVLAKAIG